MRQFLDLRSVRAACAAPLLFSLSIVAHADVVTVQGASDIWLAGQPAGSSVTGVFGTDSLPANAPTQIAVAGGQTLTFSVTGTTSNNGVCVETSADAGNCFADVGVFNSPTNGLSSYMGPANALIGVFLDNSTPSGSGGPATLDFTAATGDTSFASLSPELNQIFFIGDGLTGTGSGSIQDFIAPAGATRLFLASADAVGASYDNTGSFTVTTPAAAVPEPGSVALLGAVAGWFALRRRRR